MTVLNLDCRHGLALLPDNSVDAILTDPPYELGFMGHAWDRSGIAYDVAMWREALRVLKPGGHMLAFSGSRTYHRMTCAIEDAGFEIRDMIMWVYGSGFPKSLDISKAIDKIYGAQRQVVGQQYRAATGRDEGYSFGESFDITAPATLAATLWEGWGTGLKPAHEPICVARKPMQAPTVAANVLAWGVGGINIDGCRIPVDPVADASQLRTMNVSQHDGADGWGMNTTGAKEGARVLGLEGRWPANFIHDGSTAVLEMFPEAAGQLAKASTRSDTRKTQNVYGNMAQGSNGAEPRPDAGSAARFFYCAKSSKRDRNEGLEHLEQRADPCDGALRDGGRKSQPRANLHPTVKPTELMRYLCRLVTPPGGLIVDPFAGSGSTGKAATLEGFQFIGFELDPQYAAIANARVEAARASMRVDNAAC